MKNTYYDYDLTNYSQDQILRLKNDIESLGFKETFPEKGGGGEIARQLLAYLTIHQDDIAANLISDVVFTSVVAISSKIYKWYKANKPQQNIPPVKPIINVSIHYEKISKIQTIFLDADREYSEEELKDILTKSEIVYASKDVFDYENDPPYEKRNENN